MDDRSLIPDPDVKDMCRHHFIARASLIRDGASPLVALLALVLIVSGCGGSKTDDPKIPGAPIVKETKELGEIGNIVPSQIAPGNRKIDPDLLTKGGADAAWVIKSLGDNRYELTVQNTSRVGYIETFDWRPPEGDTITAVNKSSAGTCSVVAANVHCSGLHLRPPQCLCGTGGSETITFTMQNPDPSLSLQGSGLVILAMTPILQNIPSKRGKPTV